MDVPVIELAAMANLSPTRLVPSRICLPMGQAFAIIPLRRPSD